jgi:hypothetical protein
MRYTVTTFKVRLEVAESGIRIKNSETAEIVARGIFNRLDADKEHFVVMGTNNKNHINGYKEDLTGTLTSSLGSPGEVFLTEGFWGHNRGILGSGVIFAILDGETIYALIFFGPYPRTVGSPSRNTPTNAHRVHSQRPAPTLQQSTGLVTQSPPMKTMVLRMLSRGHNQQIGNHILRSKLRY